MRGDFGGRRIEDQPRAPRRAIEAVIAQQDLVRRNDLAGAGAAARPLDAAHLEQVGEIAVEVQRKIESNRTIAVIAQREALIGGAAPQEDRARDVHDVLLQRDLVAVVEIRIGQVDREHGVVVAHVRPEQQRLLAVQRQLETGEKTRVVMEQPVRIAGRGADVAVAVGDDERVAALERAPRARDGLRRGNIERRFRKRIDVPQLCRQWAFNRHQHPHDLARNFTHSTGNTPIVERVSYGASPRANRGRDINCRMRHQYGRTDGCSLREN